VAWFALIIAGLLDVAWAFSMKQSEGFTCLWPSVVTVLAMVASFGLLAWSMRSLPLGTAYTIWTGIGAASHADTFGMFVGGVVVENDMDRLASRDLALDGIEKADKFEVAVALHPAADHRAVEQTERGEQGSGAVPLVDRVAVPRIA
jgi:quaternary ammonium compound-resistance protein SugE